MVIYSQIKGNDLIKQNKNYHSKSSEKKIRKEIERERKQSDDEPFNRQEVYIL